MTNSISANVNHSSQSNQFLEIKEVSNPVGNKIIGVATALPIFIGYTEVAGDPTTGASLYNTAVSLSSMTEFVQYFGGPAQAQYTVVQLGHAGSPLRGSDDSNAEVNAGPALLQFPSFSAAFCDPNGNVAMQTFLLQTNSLSDEHNQFNLYWSMEAFFACGGKDCFVVSVGSYWVNELPTPRSLPAPIPTTWVTGVIELGDQNGDPNSGKPGLNVGLSVAGNTIGPTMTVVPEACQLSSLDYAFMASNMLLQASALKDRVAILDMQIGRAHV